jgi:hypothetical protein
LALFELAPRLYEVLRLAAKLPRNGKQVRLVSFEEAQQRGEKRRIAQPVPELVGPDSGQVEKALRPTIVPERCRERGEGNSCGIIWCWVRHGLSCG